MDIVPCLERYPVQVRLENGTTVTIRPLEKSDKVLLARFFQRVSEEDRFYLKENVTAPEVIQGWIDTMDLDRVVPIVALDRDRIVADATLHRSRAPARRHIGEIRVVVDPDFRGEGLGPRMIHELVDIGTAIELERLIFELVDRRELGAIHAAVQVGFEESAVLKGRVKDVYGSYQDLVVLELNLDQNGGYIHF